MERSKSSRSSQGRHAKTGQASKRSNAKAAIEDKQVIQPEEEQPINQSVTVSSRLI